MVIGKISKEDAYSKCAHELFAFETTREITEFASSAGQKRALDAVAFGIGIRHKGFNLFVNGPQGSRRHEIVQAMIGKKAEQEDAPADWCYVNNFINPHHPKSFAFPHGESAIFKKELHDLVDILKTTLPSAVEGDVFKEKIKLINENLQRHIERLLHSLEEKANAEEIALLRSEQGILFAPMDGNKSPIDNNTFLRLPPEKRKKMETLLAKYQRELQDILNQVAILKRDADDNRRKVKRETVGQATAYLINTLKKKYENRPEIGQFLQEVEEDIIAHVDDFLYKPEGEKPNIISIFSASTPSFERYTVNILVGNHADKAPVIYEDRPTYQNLHGRIEHIAQMGVLSTNFTLIKPGSLHRANGGYLIIDANRLLMEPYAYEGLKRSLRSGQIRIEPIERLMGLMSTVTLEPEPIPLQVKIVLIGEPLLYYLLNHYDPEFQAFFKVQADFEQHMDRTPDSIQLYSSLLASVAKEEGLLPIHKNGVARIIEYASREAGDGKKMTLNVDTLADTMKEADYIARLLGKEVLTSEDVEAALEAKKRRGGRIRDRVFEAIEQDLKHIATSGQCVGQVNGLSVISLSTESFGIPTRLTALTRPGKGEVINIEKEVKLSGPIHSKGVLILESFLSARYVRDIPLSLRASLVFEQSYGDIDGDSASCAELCALLSSLAETPIQQSIAITGAISQQGEVQAIGGVNEKIEGFFDLCFSRGLSGSQGVIIPQANVRHLMLKKEVVAAIADNTFTVWAINSIDEAISLLTSIPAGERGEDGKYPEQSINGKVEAAMRSFAMQIQRFEKKHSKMDESPD